MPEDCHFVIDHGERGQKGTGWNCISKAPVSLLQQTANFAIIWFLIFREIMLDISHELSPIMKYKA